MICQWDSDMDWWLECCCILVCQCVYLLECSECGELSELSLPSCNSFGEFDQFKFRVMTDFYTKRLVVH